MPEDQIRNQKVLGFSIGRQRASDNEVRWMSGMKTFESVGPNPAPGVAGAGPARPRVGQPAAKSCKLGAARYGLIVENTVVLPAASNVSTS